MSPRVHVRAPRPTDGRRLAGLWKVLWDVHESWGSYPGSTDPRVYDDLAQRLSDEARARLAAAPGVLRVDAPDLAGVVRIYLAPLDPQKPRRLPLPIHWLGAGQVSGLAITAYDAEKPWRLTTLPARQLAIQPATKESW